MKCFLLCLAAIAVCNQVSSVNARRLLQAPSPSPSLDAELAAEIEYTLGAARSPQVSPEFEAAFGRARSYERGPVAPGANEVLRDAVDKLVGRVPAPGPELYDLAEGIVEASSLPRGRYSSFVPALAPSGKAVYDALTSILAAGR